MTTWIRQSLCGKYGANYSCPPIVSTSKSWPTPAAWNTPARTACWPSSGCARFSRLPAFISPSIQCHFTERVFRGFTSGAVNINVVEFLLEKGADFNFKNINGKKPSELAYDSGFYDVSDILLTKENEFYKGSIKEEKNEDEDLDLGMEEEDKKEKENKNDKQEKKEEEKEKK